MTLFNSIKTKILAVSISLVVVSLILTSFIMARESSSSAEQALHKQVANQLTSIREIKKDQIEEYLQRLQDRVKHYSVDPAIVMYMQKLETYFNVDQRHLKDVSAQRQHLVDFYNKQYKTEYDRLNATPIQNPATIVDQLDNVAVALQNSYLASDSAFGKKLDLIQPDDGLSYSKAHGESHRILKRLFKRLNVADLYLIDPSGNVVYDVQKNPAFATNLDKGPYRNSLLARTYKQALKSNDANYVAVSDIELDTSNFNQPAMYFASPIQNLEEADAYEMLGVLVLKVPLHDINAIMTSNANWKKFGMGNSGDVYLVGNDKTMRSNDRLLVQNKSAFLHKLSQHLKPEVLKTMALQDNSIARLHIDNPAIDAALAGKSGDMIAHDFSNTPKLTAYAPLRFKHLNWAIVSDIDTAEAFAASKALTRKIGLTGLVISIVMIGVAALVGILFATRLTGPVRRMSQTMQNIEQTSDLTQRIEVNSTDEIGVMANAMNNMLEKFRNSLEKVSASTTMLATASEEMASITQGTNQNVNRQFNEIDQVATAINEMTATVSEVAGSAGQAAEAAQEADRQSSEGKHVVEAAIDSISEMSNELEQVSLVIDNLNKHSDDIGMVMDVIKGIAEQTNLLALNAAIEAARAGEQGRGFAVVADEVRTLASRTQQSTVEIENMIAHLQKEANGAVTAMKKSRERGEQSVKNAASVGEALLTITQSVNAINDMNAMIASAAEEQSTVTEEINKNIVSIKQAAEQTTQGTSQTFEASEELSKLATELQQLVAEFKTA